MSPRKLNMESSIYLGNDGRWHGRVTMGVKNDGSPDRRHRQAKTEPAVRRKVKELEKLRDEGRAPVAGRKPTVAEWMTTYLTTIASLKLKPRSLDDYWSKTRNDIIPGLGQHRLDKLAPEHLETLYAAMLEEGHAPSHVLKVHRILSRALKIAHRRRIIVENVATLVDPPSVDETEANPFTTEEAKGFLEAAAKRPNFMRWAVGVGMGFRQGETLGLRWRYVDLENELFHPRWQLQRLTWRHGCKDPHACGARLHRFEPCPPDCATHKTYKRGCPEPCSKMCNAHASACPERKGGGLVFTRPKTKKSQNPVPIPPPFIPYLLAHKAQQEDMRTAAGDEWEEHDAVFARPDGRPLDPRADWEEFKELLEEAGISDRRLYDGSRHTAGTILNELGVDMPTIMEILRHTQISQTRRYVKGRSHLSKDAMRRMGEFFVPPSENPAAIKTDPVGTRAARSRRRRIR
ncbi:tyrosine-type recombinase/integrase [Streptomyces violaceusniger]|uniref:tyrosine-type recombinase/integrase n=1 Tax=Streptomyces violaceusniger TaxID=68280 RepID=UPI00099744B6|nr:tyrosine-type recombinase/integrase [Streptomyces hygroscopicus]AQW51793.1 integrase [Streptomyces hygroscopicus]